MISDALTGRLTHSAHVEARTHTCARVARSCEQEQKSSAERARTLTRSERDNVIEVRQRFQNPCGSPHTCRRYRSNCVTPTQPPALQRDRRDPLAEVRPTFCQSLSASRSDIYRSAAVALIRKGFSFSKRLSRADLPARNFPARKGRRDSRPR